MNVSKHKPLLVRITYNQNQFYIIISPKINSPHDTTKHTQNDQTFWHRLHK